MIASIAFPKIFKANQAQLIYGKAATYNNIKLILLSKIGEFFGDPEYGSGVERNLYQFNNTLLLDILKDQIYTTLYNYIPLFIVDRDSGITITIVDKLTLNISIYGFNNSTQEDNMFNLDIAIND